MQIWQNFLAAIKPFLHIKSCRKNIYGSKMNKTQGVRSGIHLPSPRQTAIQPSSMAADFKRQQTTARSRKYPDLKIAMWCIQVLYEGSCTAGQPQSSETNSRGAAPGFHCVNMAWWEPSKTRGRSSAHAIVLEKNSNNTGTCVTLEQRAPLRIKTRWWWCHKRRHTYLDL